MVPRPRVEDCPLAHFCYLLGGRRYYDPPMHAHRPSRRRPWAAAILAGAGALGCPEVSHARSADGFIVVVATPFGHGTLLPAYVSVLYYAAASDKAMPVGWAVPNILSSLATVSLGVWALSTELNEGASRVAAGSLIVGGAVTLAATILQTSRSPGKQSSLLVLPTLGAPGSSGEGAGAVVAGTF